MPSKSQSTDAFLASLDEQLDLIDEAEPWRAEAILSLYSCHYTEPKSPFLAMSAMVLSGHIGIPAPIWAVKLVDAAINDYITSPDVKSLDVALGFKGKGTGKAKAAEAPQRLRKVMQERLCLSVHKLVAGGLPKTEACRKVAKQVKALFSKDGETSSSLWLTNCYSVKPPNADTLLGYYQEWEKNQQRLDEIQQLFSGKKNIEDLKGLINTLINVGQCFLANPSQPLDEPTTLAMKKFLDCLKPSPPSQS